MLSQKIPRCIILILLCVQYMISAEKTTDNLFGFTVQDSNGKIVSLEKYKGMVVLVVNVASECGYTDGHYKDLVQLQKMYNDKGFTVLAFPCNQFGNQEPGDNKQITTFATNRYGVSFPIFSKVNVVGEDTPAVWKFLTA